MTRPKDGNRCLPLPKPTLPGGETDNNSGEASRRVAKPTGAMEFLSYIFHRMNP